MSDRGSSMCKHGDTNPLACKLCNGKPSERVLEFMQQRIACSVYMNPALPAVVCPEGYQKIHDDLVKLLASERASLPESVDWYLLNRCPSFIIEPYKAWKDGA